MVLKREAELEVSAECDQVMNEIKDADPTFWFEGVDRVVDKGSKRGGYFVVYHSTKYKQTRIEINVKPEQTRILYNIKGDLVGTIIVSFVPRGTSCRVYIEAEGKEGKILDEHGVEAVIRIVNRFTTFITSRYSARLLPKVPFKLGDIVAEALKSIAIATEGVDVLQSSAVALKHVTGDIIGKKVVTVDGIESNRAAMILENLSEIYAKLESISQAMNTGQVQRIAILTDKAVYSIQVMGGIATVFVLEKEKTED